MDIKFKKSINEDYRGEYVGALETSLSDEDIKTQVLTHITSTYDVQTRNVNIDVMSDDIVIGDATRKLVRVEVSFYKNNETNEVQSVSLREYA